MPMVIYPLQIDSEGEGKDADGDPPLQIDGEVRDTDGDPPCSKLMAKVKLKMLMAIPPLQNVGECVIEDVDGDPHSKSMKAVLLTPKLIAKTLRK